MTSHNHAETLESETKVARVEGNALQTLLALTRANISVNQLEGGKNLHENRGGRGFAKDGGGVGAAKLVNDVLLRSNVASVGAERLGQSAHEDVDFRGVNAIVIANTTAVGSQGTDGVSLVDKQVKLVLALQFQDSGQVDHGTFHRVETFDDQENLLPGAVSSWLALGNGFTKNTLEVAHVVVLERLNDSTRKTSTDSDRGMVQFVGDDQATLGHKCRERAGVGDVAHGEDHGVGLSNKGRNFPLDFESQIRSAAVSSGAGKGGSVLLDAFLDGIGTGTLRLSKTEIVVGTHV